MGNLDVPLNLLEGFARGSNFSMFILDLCRGFTLINEAETAGSIIGVKVARESQPLNHLFFADDNLIFCRATYSDWQEIKIQLTNYEAVSEQGINKYNNSIFYGTNTS